MIAATFWFMVVPERITEKLDTVSIKIVIDKCKIVLHHF